MVHYLTVGRFGFTEDSVPPDLMERVMSHFVPGGLKQLGGETSYVVPWNEAELLKLAEAVHERYDLELDLAEYLNPQGLLCMQYTGTQLNVAFPVAEVAHELFGASAGERGCLYSPEQVSKHAAKDAKANQTRLAIKRLKKPRARLAALLKAKQPLYVALHLLADVAEGVVPELIELLKSESDWRVRLACGGLAHAGEAAASAVPALTALLPRIDPHEPSAAAASQPRSADAWSVTHALAAIGPAAEPGLIAALDCEGLGQTTALQALAKLPQLSPASRARLEELVAEGGDLAELAKHALGCSAIEKRLTALRAKLSEVTERSNQSETRLRLAAQLGDPGSRHALGLDLEAPIDVEPLCIDWLPAVAAAALDAHSSSQLPRSAALSQALAEAIREGEAPERFEPLLEEHDWMHIPGFAYSLLCLAVSASVSPLALRELLGEVRKADAWEEFTVLLREHAIPRVLKVEN